MKRYLKIASFLLISALFLSFTTHKFYFSLTDINFNRENKSLEIITNVFMDDIELELNKKYNVDLRLTTKEQYKNTDSIFKMYFKEKLDFKINNQTKDFKYLGFDFEGDLVYIYMEILDIKNPKTFEIKNKILIEEFSDQQNVVKIKIDKKRKSDILDEKKTKTLLKF